MKGNILLAVVIAIVLFSCKNRNSTNSSMAEDYRFFNLERVGWKSRKASHTLTNIEYSASLVPIQYYIAKNLQTSSGHQIDSVFELYKDERVIEVEFRHTSDDDLLKSEYTQMDYGSAVEHMSFALKNDFVIVNGNNDTINCSGITFERNFKIAPFKRVLLHFGRVPENDDIQLIYFDRLFRNGILKFKFTEAPLKL